MLCASAQVFRLDLEYELLAEDRDIGRRLDSDPDSSVIRRNHDETDAPADTDGLTRSAGQNEHQTMLSNVCSISSTTFTIRALAA